MPSGLFACPPWKRKRRKARMGYQGKSLKTLRFSLISQEGGEYRGPADGWRAVHPRILLAPMHTHRRRGGEGTRRPSCTEGMIRGFRQGGQAPCSAAYRGFPFNANRGADAGLRRWLFMVWGGIENNKKTCGFQ